MSKHHHVAQGSLEWDLLRSDRVSSSELAQLTGFSQYKDPATAINEKIATLAKVHSRAYTSSSQEPHPAQVYFDHGHKYEYAGLMKFIEFMQKAHPEFSQNYRLPSGYHTPENNPNFPDSQDQYRFGASLDGEGDVYDVEIKNPYRYYSFKTKYATSLQVEHFVQCQWAMAVRDRSEMFYVATHFDPETEQYLALSVWHIRFHPIFFEQHLYPGAVKAHALFKKGEVLETESLPWINENNLFGDSSEWKEIFDQSCKRLHHHIEGKKLSILIRQRTGK